MMPAGERPLWGQGRPGLYHGKAHHPSDPLPPAAHRAGPPGPPMAPGGHGGELQCDLGGAADPRL